MRFANFLVLVVGFPALAQAGSRPMLEVSLGDTRYVGSPVHWNESMVWWLGRDGRVNSFPPNRVTSYRQISSQFRAFSNSEVRANLLGEFSGYTVTGSGHYLVCHAPHTSARYAPMFEDIYRSFTHYLTVRGFTVERPKFPLVAVLLPNRSAFEQYADREGVRASENVVGYYLHKSNRVALYDAGEGTSTSAVLSRNAETIIHEAVHQVAFNTGLHDRFTENPLWVVEGLAILFEAPGVWNARANPNPASRVNRDRLDDFRRYAATRRSEGALQDFVSSDDPFHTSPLDAYAEAWALTYYLVETQPRRHAHYLRRIAERPRGSTYPASERLADFRHAFGADLDLLDARYLRFIKQL